MWAVNNWSDNSHSHITKAHCYLVPADRAVLVTNWPKAHKHTSLCVLSEHSVKVELFKPCPMQLLTPYSARSRGALITKKPKSFWEEKKESCRQALNTVPIISYTLQQAFPSISLSRSRYTVRQNHKASEIIKIKNQSGFPAEILCHSGYLLQCQEENPHNCHMEYPENWGTYHNEKSKQDTHTRRHFTLIRNTLEIRRLS